MTLKNGLDVDDMHLLTNLFGSGILETDAGRKLPTEYSIQMYSTHGTLRLAGDLHFDSPAPQTLRMGRKLALQLQTGESIILSLRELQQENFVARAEIHEGLLTILYPGMRLH